MMRLVSLASIQPVPWKNGGGLTRELLCWPDTEGWQMRVSVAEVSRSGPFSAYPGVTRHFAVLQGAGVALHFPGGERTLTPASAPVQFDGVFAPDCALLVGPTLDLNVMARQDAGRADLQRAEAGRPWAGGAGWRGVFTLHAATLHMPDQAPLALPTATLAFDDAARPGAWRLAGNALCAWWLAFEPLQAAP